MQLVVPPVNPRYDQQPLKSILKKEDCRPPCCQEKQAGGKEAKQMAAAAAAAAEEWEELAENVDFYIRTRRKFDSTKPLDYR